MTKKELSNLCETELDELYGLELARSLIDKRINELIKKSKVINKKIEKES